MTRLDLKEAEKEILQSKAKIEERLKMGVSSFAYPYGSKFYNDKTINLVKNSQFIYAVETNEKLINKLHNFNIYNLPRISAGNCYWNFTVKASGMFSDFLNLFYLKK